LRLPDGRSTYGNREHEEIFVGRPDGASSTIHCAKSSYPVPRSRWGTQEEYFILSAIGAETYSYFAGDRRSPMAAQATQVYNQGT
jgi:hypothetical protein